MGIRIHGGEDTILDEIASERSGLETSAANVAHVSADVAHVLVEAPHLMHLSHGVTLGALAPVGVLAAGLGVGYAIHHAVAERREQFLGDAANLGIR